MSIVLSILQILGIALLVVLGIIVIAVVLVLCAPFFYQVEGDIHETQWVKAKISWLLHLIRGRIAYEDDLIYGEFWVFWKKTTFSFELGTKGEKEDKEEKEEKPKKKKSKSGQNRIERFKDIFPKIKKIIKDERNKQAVRHLKKEVYYFIKILLPKKSTVNAEFSTGSPDTTGQLCGVIACFPVMYQKSWTLRPDFMAEEGYFKGDFRGKGRLYAFQLVGILLRIMFDKNCRRMYTMIDRLMKRMKNKQAQEGK